MINPDTSHGKWGRPHDVDPSWNLSLPHKHVCGGSQDCTETVVGKKDGLFPLHLRPAPQM